MIVLLENRSDRAGLTELATNGESAAGKAVQGNDARMSNARAPTAHAASHAPGGSDPIGGFFTPTWFKGQATGFSGGSLDYTAVAQSDPGHFSIDGNGDINILVNGVYLITWTALNAAGGGNSTSLNFPGVGPISATATQAGAAPAQANTSSTIVSGTGAIVVTATGVFGIGLENTITITRIG